MGVLSLISVVVAWGVQGASETGESKSPKGSKSSEPKAVLFTLVKEGTLPLVAEYRGELDSDVAELASQGSGRLLEVVVNLGDHFKQGEVLARVDGSETRRLLSEALAQSQSARAAQERNAALLATARGEAKRGEAMVAERVASEQELVALQSQVKVLEAETRAADAAYAAAAARVALFQEQLARAALKAPFDGAVAHRYLDPGATVAPGTEVLRLIKSGPLEVKFRASELHVTRLKPGTKLSVFTLATGQRAFEGTLSRLSAEVSRTDRSVAAEGVLLREHSELRPGMYASVKVSLGLLESAQIVPDAALVSRLNSEGETERGVYVVEGKKASYRMVEILGAHQGQVALSGVKAGEKAVVEGQDLLSDGVSVQALEKKSK